MLSPTGLIPWFSKTEGNTYATLLHHPFLFKGKPTHAQEVARRIFSVVTGEICTKSSQDLISQQLAISGAVAGEIYAQVKTYQVPITNSYPSHYIICHLPLIFLSLTSPLPFYSPFFRSSFRLLYPILPWKYLSTVSREARRLPWIMPGAPPPRPERAWASQWPPAAYSPCSAT